MPSEDFVNGCQGERKFVISYKLALYSSSPKFSPFSKVQNYSLMFFGHLPIGASVRLLTFVMQAVKACFFISPKPFPKGGSRNSATAANQTCIASFLIKLYLS